MDLKQRFKEVEQIYNERVNKKADDANYWRGRRDEISEIVRGVPEVAEAVKEIISVIWLCDNSDYIKALWTVLRILNTEAATLAENNINEAYKKYANEV